MLRREETLAVPVTSWELTTALGGVARAHDVLETFLELSVFLLKVKHLFVAIAQERVETLQVLLGTNQLAGVV